MRLSRISLTAALALALAAPVMAQDPAPSGGPKVGDLAPDFTLPASTQAGVNPRPIRLSELRGQVVVIAFFPKSRTRG
jgi:peroxiredoxin Q/BCP